MNFLYHPVSFQFSFNMQVYLTKHKRVLFFVLLAYLASTISYILSHFTGFLENLV